MDYFWGYFSGAKVELIPMLFQTLWKKISLRNLLLQMVCTTEIVSCLNTCTSHRRVDDDSVIQGFDCEIIFLIIRTSQVIFVAYKRTEYTLVCFWVRIYVPTNTNVLRRYFLKFQTVKFSMSSAFYFAKLCPCFTLK